VVSIPRLTALCLTDRRLRGTFLDYYF